MSTKGVSSLLSYTLWHAITFPITYLLVFVLAFTALMQIRYINRALQRFDSTQVIPTQFVLFTLSVIVGSAVLYRDFESTSASRAVKFIGGCIMTFVGVYFITSGRAHRDDDSAFSIIEDDEEEAIGLLAGEQFRNSSDSRSKAQREDASKARRPHQHDDMLPSSGASLLSVGSEDIDGQPTPRGVLSPSPSSTGDSLNDGSTPERSSPDKGPSPSSPDKGPSPSPTKEQQQQQQQREHQQPMETQQNTPELPSHPTTAPADETESERISPNESTVLLKFPVAPGVEDSIIHSDPVDHQKSLSAEDHHRRLHYHSHDGYQARPRNAVRFPTGRFLPTISTGFSAVVAESLRRGETSPVHRRHRRKRSAGGGGGHDDHYYDNGETNHDEDLHEGNDEEGHPPPPPIVVDSEDRPGSNTRLRSLSDSWNGGLSLRKDESQQRRSVSGAEGMCDADGVGVSSTPASEPVIEHMEGQETGGGGGGGEGEQEHSSL